MQEPGVSYTFEGGTTFSFLEAPKFEDKIDVFFYRGTRGDDSIEINVNETLKIGDEVQVSKNDLLSGTVTQESRIISNITSADTIETGIYLGDGIDEVNYKPLSWSKQKRDLLIGDNYQPKSRDSLEGMVFPTSKIIKDFSSSDTEIFLDDAQFFNYEENESSVNIQDFSGLVFDGKVEPVGASFTAIVSSAGTITSINVIDGGSGYVPSASLSVVVAPPIGGIGTVFKPIIKNRVGTLGIGSDVIIGINTTSIEIGQSLDRVFAGTLEIIDDTFTVTGISTENNGKITLNKSASNTVQIVRTFDFGRYQDQERATANTVVSAAGTIQSVSIVNAGSGYTTTATPSIITKLPDANKELIFRNTLCIWI